MKEETNKSRIIKALTDAQGQWVGGSTVMAVGGSRFSARIEELREEGYVIEGRRNDRYALWDYRLAMLQPIPTPPTEWECTQKDCHYRVALVIPTISDYYGNAYCNVHGVQPFKRIREVAEPARSGS